MLIYLDSSEARDEKDFSMTNINGKDFMQYDKYNMNNGMMNLIPMDEWNSILSKQDLLKENFEIRDAKEKAWNEKLMLKEKNNKEYEKFYGFFKTMSKLNAGKVKKALEVKYLYTEFDEIMTRKEHLEKLYASGEFSHAEGKELLRKENDWRKILTTVAEGNYFNYLQENNIIVDINLKFMD